MKIARFMDYYSAGGDNVFMDWYRQQAPSVRAVCDFTIQEVQKTEILESSESFKTLQRAHVGICELKFRVDDGTGTGLRHFRPLGFWNYDCREFVLVTGARKPIPGNIFNDVLGIQERYFRFGTGVIYEHWL
jgi:hypothetical protein